MDDTTLAARSQSITVTALGKRLGLSGQTIRREIVEGELPAFRTAGGHYRIAASDADRYVARITGNNRHNAQK